MSAWTRVARLYDLQLPLERHALHALASMLELDACTHLLDVATGTGAMLHAARQLQPPPRRATGIDSAPRMLARVRGLPADWQLVRADAAAMPFPDAAFDRVSAAYLLHLLDPASRAAVLAEINRVLAPGGLLGVATVSPPRGTPQRILRAPIQTLAGTSRGTLAGLQSLNPRPDLERAGFTALRGQRTRRGYPTLCLVAARAVVPPQ